MLAPALPSLVKGEVRHARFGPTEHAFRHRAHQWLVDADAPQAAPRWLRPVASIEARDHIGSPDASIGDNVRAFLSAHDVPWTARRIVMLANARAFGYVFDPLSVFWCFDADGALEGVVAEVHNTYGERHAYVVEVDERGTGRADKEFYVSPFFGVFGDYRLKFLLDGAKVAAHVTLKQEGRVVFTASFTGQAVPATPRRVLATALAQPLMPQRVSALIRWHGIRLWLRRVPLVRRLPHAEQEAVR